MTDRSNGQCETPALTLWPLLPELGLRGAHGSSYYYGHNQPRNTEDGQTQSYEPYPCAHTRYSRVKQTRQQNYLPIFFGHSLLHMNTVSAQRVELNAG